MEYKGKTRTFVSYGYSLHCSIKGDTKWLFGMRWVVYTYKRTWITNDMMTLQDGYSGKRSKTKTWGHGVKAREEG